MNEREQRELDELLMNSSQGVNIQQITELIEAGADINAVNEFGQTPLHKAAALNHREVVELLLDRGANVNAVERRKWTPLHTAIRFGNREIVELLLDRRANVNAVDNINMTPLHFAVKYAQEELVKLLLDRGANVNAVTTAGKRTPLHFAVMLGYRQIAKLLLDRGANVNAVNNSGDTPLHLAVNYSQEGLVKLLLEKGASVSAVDKKGRTPLSIVASDYSVWYCGQIILLGHIIAYAVLYSDTTTKPEYIVENSELSKLWDYYQNEMMNIKLNNSTISLYQFLRETDEDKLAGYLSDKEYDEIRRSEVLKYISEFPEHTDAIVSQFDKALERRDLLDKSKAAIPSQNLDNPSAEQLQAATSALAEI